MKVASLLSAPNNDGVNLGLLESVPVEYLHEVLEFVAHYPDEKNWACMSRMLREDVEAEAPQKRPEELIYNTPNEYDVVFHLPAGDRNEEDEEDEEEALRQAEIKSLSNLFHAVKGLIVPTLFGDELQ